MSRSFGRWQKTECDRCGCEFQVTRTHEKEFEGEIICNDCEVYDLGYKGGKTIEEYPLYTVYKEGYLVSSLSGKKVVGSKDKNGYLTVTLYKEKGGKGKTHKLHRLVAKAFVDNPEDKPQVNHIDGNKSNPHYSNLEWVTNGENQLHAFKTGLQKNKLTDKQVVDIIADNRYHYLIAKDYGVDPSHISLLKSGKRRKSFYDIAKTI